MRTRSRMAQRVGIGAVVLLLLIGGVWWGMQLSRTEVVERGATTKVTTQGSRKVKTKEFYDAVEKNQIDKVKAMLAEDPTLAKEKQGSTPLHQAAWGGYVEMANLLIDNGAELEVVEPQHHGTALQWAVVAGRRDAVKVLMERGAKATVWMLSLAEQGGLGLLEDFAPNKREAYPEVAQLLREKGVGDDGSTRFMHYRRDPAVKMEGATAIQKSWSEAMVARMKAEGNLLATMSNFGCAATRGDEGMELTVRLDESGLLSEKVYKTPVTIETVAMTDSTNLRLYFGKAWVIFNWERNGTELRIVDPATGKFDGVADQGDIPRKQWVTIQWVIGPKEMRIVVDGQERYKAEGNYAGIEGRVGIGPAWQSKVTVKSITVTEADGTPGL
jgi:hypothetical protein